MTYRQWEYLFLGFVFCASLFLFGANLGNQSLWQDESQTALLSKTILTEGVPRGTDGKNFFSQEFKAEYGENYIWKWHTWLPFYIVAAFFKMFGESTFTARLPFAIFGIATVFLTYYFGRYLWGNRKTAGIGAVLLLISVPFLVMSRQCRYYSVAAFFSLLSLFAYTCILDKKKFASIVFVAGLVALFHTHYLYFATMIAAVIVHMLIFRRDKLIVVLLLCAVSILINVPWIIWLTSMKYGDQYGKGMFGAAKIFKFAGGYLNILAQQIFNPLLLFILPLAGIANKARGGKFLSSGIKVTAFWSRICLLLLFAAATISALSVASPWFYLRYLMPLIAVFAMIAAPIIASAARVHWVVSGIVIVTMACTSYFGDYLYELTHDYDGPIEGIVKYLNENGDPDDVVLIAYGDMGVKFYTEMRVYGGLTAEDLSTVTEPDWIIDRKSVNQRMWPVKQHIRNILKKGGYSGTVIDYPDLGFENREDPKQRNFRTVTNEDRVVIWKKKDR